MMISYFHLLFIVASGQSVLDNYLTHLLHLVGFGLSSLRLEMEDLLHTVLRKDVVIPTNSLLEPQTPQKMAKVFEGDVGIGHATQDMRKEFIELGHPQSCTSSTLPR